tara:strand:+ start:2333 stop:3100 length:768 start_codon:yes stop_codon:yes gene_type:complete
MSPDPAVRKVALVTGSAARIGACIARHLHSQGFNIALHYHKSATEAEVLCRELNRSHENSAACFDANLLDVNALESLVQKVLLNWNRLDALINNASSFYPTPLTDINEAQWSDLIGTNAKAPVFLSKACMPALKKSKGSIINITDIAGNSGRENFLLYTMAKAALTTLSKSLARELAPEVRVNAVAPGVILPPNFSEPQASMENNEQNVSSTQTLTCLNYAGKPEDIAYAVNFLIQNTYITGQTLSVDGGKKLLS